MQSGTDALLSLGGDGTFLSAAHIALPSDLPIIGVNFGRMGFLSECKPSELASAISRGEFGIQSRDLLQVGLSGDDIFGDFWPFALNEMSVSRVGASMLGIDVDIDGASLPTYWADGLIVATSSGSTAYSMSVGGPICSPDSKVFIVSPISPHNLNIRPLIVPLSSKLSISLRSRSARAIFSLDNNTYIIPADTRIEVRVSDTPLKRLTLGNSNFIDALRTRLLWGEDVRNESENYNNGTNK